MKKTDEEGGRITVHYYRILDPDEIVKDVLKHALQKHGGIRPGAALSALLGDQVLLYVDGLHESDAGIPRHYDGLTKATQAFPAIISPQVADITPLQENLRGLQLWLS
jgi:hypothetical protein